MTTRAVPSHEAPSDTEPALIPLGIDIGRSQDCCVTLSFAQVFPEGVLLTTTVRFANTSAEQLRAAQRLFPWNANGNGLHLHAEVSDGTTSTARSEAPSGSLRQATFQHVGGAGANTVWTAPTWLSPVPHDDIRISASWDEHNLTPHHAVITRTALVEALSRVRKVWRHDD